LKGQLRVDVCEYARTLEQQRAQECIIRAIQIIEGSQPYDFKYFRNNSCAAAADPADDQRPIGHVYHPITDPRDFRVVGPFMTEGVGGVRSLRSRAGTGRRSRCSPTTAVRFRAFGFSAMIASRLEPPHVLTRVPSPRQNGARERAFQPRKYERLYREPIEDALDLVSSIRPHEALAWNPPPNVHEG
jgi:hypothetical protein